MYQKKNLKTIKSQIHLYKQEESKFSQKKNKKMKIKTEISKIENIKMVMKSQ